nr:AraC family transcriptional regulator [Pseudoalteromonas sp. MMG022]
MGYSCATFKRKLKQHQTSFKELKDELQKQQSLFNITERGYSNEQAAAALSFNDTTNFRRAFKRWTGKTPSEYRHILSR